MGVCQAFLTLMPRVAARKTRQGVCTAIGPENRLARTTKAKTVKGSREAMSHKKAAEAVIGHRGPAAAKVHRSIGGESP